MAVLKVAAGFPARHRHDAPMPVFGRSGGLSEPVLDAQSAPLSGPDGTDLTLVVLDLVRAAAACASFCEHAEHNEPASISHVIVAGQTMRRVAARLAAQSQLSLRQLYEDRIRGVEAGSLLAGGGDGSTALLTGAVALSTARHWDEVQAAQVVHDRHFHPDVFGLSKTDQLRHYTFHVTKLSGLLADAFEYGNWDEFRERRLADVAVFGVKLATVCNERLPATDVDLP